MKTNRTIRVLSTAMIAGSMLLTQTAPAFAEMNVPAQMEMMLAGDTVTLTYDKNCSDYVDVPEKQDVQQQSDVTISYETPVRGGYSFAGWSTDKNATADDALVHEGDEFTLDKDTKLYAVWVNEDPSAEGETSEETAAQAVTYQVMLDTHGGSMSVHSVDSDESGVATLPMEEPVKDGSTFLGWADSPETNVVVYYPGAQIPLDSDLKLYAVWQENAPVQTFQVMLDSHGGTMSIDHVDSDESGIATLPMEEPVKDGFVFLGWADSPETNVVVYYPGAQIALNNDLKLYAVWQAVTPATTYQVMLDTHGGSMSIHSVNSDENGIATLPMEEPVKDGYVFLGWADSPETNVVVYYPGAQIALNNDLKLYAVWQAVTPVQTFQVMLDTHGGSMSIHSVNSDENGIATLPMEEPVKDGFTFLGWADSPETNVVVYYPGAQIALNNDLKLYAVWQANTPAIQATVTFDPNGGTGGPTSVTTDANGNVTLPTLMPVRNGFKFMGWSANQKATSATYMPGQTINVNADFKLYAVWQDNSKVPTGVQNNVLFYVFTAFAAVILAACAFVMRKKEN